MPRTTKLHDEKGRGIDIKGEGGYVVAAPSIHPNGSKYEIISKTNKIDVVDLDGLMDVLKTNGFKGSFDLDLGRLHHVMNDQITEGERNDSLFIADKHMMNPNEKGMEPEEARKILGDINATRVSPPLTEHLISKCFSAMRFLSAYTLALRPFGSPSFIIKKMRDRL